MKKKITSRPDKLVPLGSLSEHPQFHQKPLLFIKKKLDIANSGLRL